MTSFDCIARLRRILHTKKVGHSGTLDPNVDGVLPIAIGNATKAVEYLMASGKEYAGELTIGLATTTEDLDGEVVDQKPVPAPIAREMIAEKMAEMTGEITQVPPMYSALKVDGKKLSEIARRGGEVARAARPVTIGELTVLGEADGDYVLRVRCSKGTYIRTLCHDIGAALGCGGVMSALRRTEVGGYRVEDAHTMDELCALPREAAQRLLLSVDSLWPDAPQVTVDAKAERLARFGNPFTLSAPDGTYRIYAASGEFLLLAQVTDGTAVTIKSFFEVS